MWINQHILNLDINTHPRWVMSLDSEQYFHLATRKLERRKTFPTHFTMNCRLLKRAVTTSFPNSHVKVRLLDLKLLYIVGICSKTFMCLFFEWHLLVNRVIVYRLLTGVSGIFSDQSKSLIQVWCRLWGTQVVSVWCQKLVNIMAFRATKSGINRDVQNKVNIHNIYIPSRQNSLESTLILGWEVELKQRWWMVVKWNSKQPRFWVDFQLILNLESRLILRCYHNFSQPKFKP